MNANVTKTNGVKLFALVAVLAMVFAGAAVIMNDSNAVDGTSTTTGGTTYLSGDITATQDFGVGTNVVVNGELTIPAGMALIISGGKLTVNAGASIVIDAGGQLIIQSTSLVTINGDIIASGKPVKTEYEANKAYAPYYAAIVNNTVTAQDGKTSGVFVSGNITLEKGAELVNIESGASPFAGTDSPDDKVNITGNTKGEINLLAGSTLNITERSRAASVIGGQDVIINSGATLKINGNVTGTVNVKAAGTGTYYTAAAVSITDTGRDYADASTSNLTFTVSVQNTQALTDKDNDKSNVTLRQYILNVEGTLDNNEKMTVGGGVSYTVKDGTSTPDVFYATTGYNYIIFPTVTVTGNLEIAASSDFSIDKENQMDVSGTLEIVYDADLEKYGATTDNTTGTDVRGKTVISGTLYVTGSATGAYYTGTNYSSFSLNQTADSATNSNRIVVDGGSITLETTATMDAFIKANSSSSRVYGSMYMADGASTKDPSTIYIVDFDVAVEGAVAAESDDIYVFAFGAQNDYAGVTSAEVSTDRGAYVIDADITIPDGLNITVWNALVVGEGATLTIEEGATIEIALTDRSSKTPAILWVDGKVVDYDGCMDTYRGTDIGETTKGIFKYEVMKITDTDTEYYVTYTSLKIAISEAQPGEKIQLNGSVIIDSDLTIPADVTVITDGDATAPVLTVKGATLTINGTLEISDLDSGTATVKIEKNSNGTRDGSIIVNNVIANATYSTFTGGVVAGAYYNAAIGDDTVGTNYVTSISVASANSASVVTGNNIEIYGTVSMGDATFTAGENNTTMVVVIKNGAKASAGTVTLVGAGFQMEAGSEFTGTVAADVTAGNTSIDFNKASGLTISYDSTDNGETVTTEMILDGTLTGTATVATGTVNAGHALVVGRYVDNTAYTLTVGEGATMNVLEGGLLTVYSNTVDKEKAFAGLIIDGTLNLDAGTINNGQSKSAPGQIDINGTFNVVSGSPAITGIINVDGVLAVSEEVGDEATLTVTKMYVGANGIVTGTVNLAANTQVGEATKTNIYSFVVLYPGADVTGAAIAEDNEGNLISGVATTEYFINGDLYMTSYAMSGTTLSEIVPETIKMTGYNGIVLGASSGKETDWYADEAMKTTKLYGDSKVEDVSVAYAEAKLMNAAVKLSIGPGMSVFIDDVRYDSDIISLAVGEHTIVVQVNPGYAGTATVTLGGAAVTDGKFTITPEMAEEYTYSGTVTDGIVLSVMGDISYDTGSSGDDGMGLTEILLVILVILIVVMAIMVALRLMRS